MKKKVLVIEDEPVIAEMISIILEVQGLKVISLSDTSRARKKLDQKDVDLVLLDLNLRGEDGKSFCEYIKSHNDLKHIPVILVSANTNIDQVRKECGADDLIQKPFDLDFFIEKVHLYTGKMAPNV